MWSTSELGYLVSLHAIEPTRPRGQRRVDGVESPRATALRLWGPEILISTQVIAWRCAAGVLPLPFSQPNIFR